MKDKNFFFIFVILLFQIYFEKRATWKKTLCFHFSVHLMKITNEIVGTFTISFVEVDKVVHFVVSHCKEIIFHYKVNSTVNFTPVTSI